MCTPSWEDTAREQRLHRVYQGGVQQVTSGSRCCSITSSSQARAVRVLLLVSSEARISGINRRKAATDGRVQCSLRDRRAERSKDKFQQTALPSFFPYFFSSPFFFSSTHCRGAADCSLSTLSFGANCSPATSLPPLLPDFFLSISSLSFLHLMVVAALPSFIPWGCCSSFFHSTAPPQQPLLLLLPSSRASPGSRPPVPPPAGSPRHGHAAQRLLLCLGAASPPRYLGASSCAAHHPPAQRRMALGWTPQPCRASRARHGMLGWAVPFDRLAFQARFGPPLPCLFSPPRVVPDRSCLRLIEKSTVQLLPLTRSIVLPVVDLASSDLRVAAKCIRQACVEYGFFYVANHGIEGALIERVFAESKKFFDLPMEEKMALRKNGSHRGYTAPYSEKINASSDLKESFYIGPMGDEDLQHDVNQWPSEERFLCWKETMKLYHESALATSKRILSLIALSLDLDVEFFQDNLSAFLRLLHYSGDVSESDNESYGAAAHSDYGMITLLATDGTPGLQVCREKDRHPQLWEDVHHIDGALIVNIGDLLERWTNCVFRSTLHRVVTVGKERYSMAFFIDPNPDLVVKCLESCCSEAYPPWFPPIRSGDYIEERFRATYKLATV